MNKIFISVIALLLSIGFAFGQTVLPPSSTVNGVHVYNLNNSSWSGANIILGSDAAVWPWATAGTDGLAFTPVAGKTYHMTFNVTSSGASGFRVRWIKDDTNGGYTSGDVAVVNSHVYTADQTATVIPAYFQGTITNGQTLIYKVDVTMDGSQPADALVGNIAIRGQQGSNDFIINTLVITDDAGNQLVNYDVNAAPCVVVAPSANVPGVTIGDPSSWAGANIILGSDQSVWPWSTGAGDGVVAFTPVAGSTYHMTFNITSSGASGFRVRWIKNNDGGGNYTAGDAAVVNNAVYTADQTATVIPAYFQNTITSGQTITYKVDVTMDGSQPADALVGNIAIRGQQGSNDFVINTLVITDDAGCTIVNYDLTASAVPTVDTPKLNAYCTGKTLHFGQNVDKAVIYNVAGQQVFTFANSNSANLSGFPTGIYQAKVLLNGQIHNVKFILQ